MEFRILGSLEVAGETGPVVLPRGRGRALLALLVLRAGEAISTERLIDELWGEASPATATTALHGLVSTLRKRLEPHRDRAEVPTVLQTRAPGYVLAVDPEQVDANRFARLVAAASDATAIEKAAQLREALTLWRGPALADFTYEPFAQSAITQLEALRLTAIEERIDADIALGRHAELVGELQALVANHPLRERPHAHLMLVLYRCGRQAEALGVYGDLRRVLVEELGIEPGPALRDLEQAILRQDPSLDRQPPTDRPPPSAPPGAPTPAGQTGLALELRTLTVVFVDLAPSSAPRESDPEALRRIARRAYATTTRALERHGATVQGFIGDVVVAVFGLPTLHEDDALRAVRAATDLRRDLAAMNETLEREHGVSVAARVGINTGEVLVGGAGAGTTDASGAAVNMAAQLQQAAVEGEVLLGDTTRRLVGEAALVEPVERAVSVHGRPATIGWRLHELTQGALERVPRRDTPIVGRTAELARLGTAFDGVVRARRGALITVLGEAGIGKSRLALELADTLGADARVLMGRCPAYGEGITFWPLREVVLQAVGGRGRDGLEGLLADEKDGPRSAAAIADAIGLGDDAGSAEALFPAVRHLVETLAHRQPLVIVLDDVHWAQPTFLDLVEYLVGSTRQAVLLLCLARPELLEQRPAWVSNRSDGASLSLGPLDAEESRKLVADRLSTRVLPLETVSQVIEMSQGNPLFVEQMLAALRDQRDLAIPPSVQALLAARLDRLGPAERDLLRCASVAGTDFSTQALSALVPAAARPFADSHLRVLEDKELIRPAGQRFLGQPAFTFRHVLVQGAAYRSMTRQARSELHERFADWLGNEAGDRSLELDEVVGYHLEQAYEQRRHIGLDDEHSNGLATRAGERLAGSGLRAYALFDVAAAENLFSRATALLPSDHPECPRVTQHLAEAYQVLGRHGEADGLLAQMLQQATGSSGKQVIRLERARVRLFVGPDPVPLAPIRREAEDGLLMLTDAGDEAGLALACYVLGLVQMRRGELREMEATAWRGLAHADRSGEPREEVQARVNVAVAVVAGETPVADCLEACDQIAPWRGIDHPMILCEQAGLRAMLGELDVARELIARARRLLVERIRARRPLMFAAQRSAEVETLAGDVAAAEDELRDALQLARAMGERDQISIIAASLSRVLSRSGSGEEATELAAMSTEHAPAESVAAQALSRLATARVLADRDDHEQAQRLARKAVDLTPCAMLNLGADLRVDLAGILLGGGQREAATTIAREAADLYERKGNLVGAHRARALVGS